MNLLVKRFKEIIKENDNIRIIFSGRRENLRKDVIKAIEEMEENTKYSKQYLLNICFNFGGRADIIDATRKIANSVKEGKLDIEDINEDMYFKYLYNEIPDIDLLIRTSGECRISNFMLYQLSYAEIYFPEKLFPDFKKDDFDKALDIYNNRDRRYGSAK